MTKKYRKCSFQLSGTAALIISNKEIEDIMKIVKSLEEFGLLIKSASETIENEAKKQKVGFLGVLLGVRGASLSEHFMACKGVIQAADEANR